MTTSPSSPKDSQQYLQLQVQIKTLHKFLIYCAPTPALPLPIPCSTSDESKFVGTYDVTYPGPNLDKCLLVRFVATMLQHVALKVGPELCGVGALCALEHCGVFVGMLLLVGVKLNLAVRLVGTEVAAEQAGVDVAGLQMAYDLVLAFAREETQLALVQVSLPTAHFPSRLAGSIAEETGQAGIGNLFTEQLGDKLTWTAGR